MTMNKKFFCFFLLIVFVINSLVSTSNLCMKVHAEDLYTLTITAQNGYVIKSPDKEFYEYGETVRLFSRPATGYSFASWGGDTTGTRLIADVVIDGNKSVTANFESWTAPIGIPEPEFGIFETTLIPVQLIRITRMGQPANLEKLFPARPMYQQVP